MKRSRIPQIMSMMVMGAAVAAMAAPAFAQTDDQDIIVTGRYGRVPSSVQSLSQPVSYADLDLSTKAGRDELRHRVNLTARYLCGKLGEQEDNDPVVPSCRQAAVSDAMGRVGTLEEHFAPRGTTWVAPAPWAPPYPADWEQRYP